MEKRTVDLKPTADINELTQTELKARKRALTICSSFSAFPYYTDAIDNFPPMEAFTAFSTYKLKEVEHNGRLRLCCAVPCYLCCWIDTYAYK